MTELSLIAKATAILGVALVITCAARRAPASVRALILATTFGLLLVLPIASALAPARELQIPEAYAPALFIQGAVEPGAPLDVVAAPNPAAQTSQSWRVPSVISLARGIWVLGVFATLGPLLLGLRRSRVIRRAAHEWSDGAVLVSTLRSSIGLRRPVSVVLCHDLVSPMTCGWRQPAIVMPADSPAWPAADVRQALLHELEHVRRHDWVVHVFARFTCALYWFHPVAWMAWRRLCLESERACDDAVVVRSENTAYAEQLVSLARRLRKRDPVPLLSMADRGTLSARVASVLSTTASRGRVGAVAMAAVVTGAAVLVTAIAPVQARTSPQTVGSPNVTVDPALRFSVASVRPNDGSDPSRGFGFTLASGRLRLRNQTLRTMISIAYSQPFGLFFPNERISGGPEWMNQDRFTLEARAERAVNANEMGAMLRALLADRFNLTVRVETKQAPVYALIRTKKDGSLGPGLKRAEVECGAGGGRCGIGGGRGRYQLAAASMPLLAASLSELVGRPVVDRTGLTGSFDGTLTWAPTPEELGALGEPAPAAPEFGASLFTAIEEQFGLKLQSERGGVDYLVVTNADQPTPNDAPEVVGAVTQSPGPTFEVASVRQNTSGSEFSRGPMIEPGNRLVARNVMVRALIMTAYGLRHEQVVNGPAWLDTTNVDVEARARDGASLDEMQAMLQTLLRERFGLRAHRESREQPVYGLMPSGSRKAPGLRAAAETCTPILAPRRPSTAPIVSVGVMESEPLVALGSRAKCQRMSFPGFIGARHITMADFAAALTPFARRTVIDRTGLAGEYDIDLVFAPDPGVGGDSVSIFTAVQEQLGLQLEAIRGPVDVLVIDAVERPTPN